MNKYKKLSWNFKIVCEKHLTKKNNNLWTGINQNVAIA
jgi:hypothetical protein